MSLRALLQGALPVTAPLVLNPLMAKMVEAAGFPSLLTRADEVIE